MSKGIIVNDNRGKEKAEPKPVTDISPKVVTDEEIAAFKDLDKKIARIKQVFNLAQITAQEELGKVANEQTDVWKKLAEKHNFDIKDPWQVSYEEKLIVPGVNKVQGK